MLRSPDRLRPPPELRSDPATQGARFLATCSRLLPRDQVIPETCYNQFPARAKPLRRCSAIICADLFAAMIEGGPCHECGATQASIWYGKRGEPKYCKKADCMRAGGYLALKKPKGAASKRARPGQAADAVKAEAESISIDATVAEIIDIYGQRCACPLPRPARARLTCLHFTH